MLAGETLSVPNFRPLGAGRHLYLFSSHLRGSAYYVGRYDSAAHRFLPERHGVITVPSIAE